MKSHDDGKVAMLSAYLPNLSLGKEALLDNARIAIITMIFRRGNFYGGLGLVKLALISPILRARTHEIYWDVCIAHYF